MNRLILLAVSVLAAPVSVLADFSSQNASVVIDADRLLMPLDSQLTPPAQLSPEELSEDVALVSFAFEQGYCGIGHLPGETVKRVKEELILLSSPKEAVTPKDFCSALMGTMSLLWRSRDFRLHVTRHGLDLIKHLCLFSMLMVSSLIFGKTAAVIRGKASP